jgi:hypothetical protein
MANALGRAWVVSNVEKITLEYASREQRKAA